MSIDMVYLRQYSFSDTLIDQLTLDVGRVQSQHVLKYVTLSPKSRAMLASELGADFPEFEYAMRFHWKNGYREHNIHIDGKYFSATRKCSLNFVISGGEGAVFQWYQCDHIEKVYSENNIASLQGRKDSCTLVHEEPMPRIALVHTGVPHRVDIKSDTVLLCVRFKGNPDLLNDN